MLRRRIWLAAIAGLFMPSVAHATPVSFQAPDGVKVHANYEGDGKHPLILLFHQAGSNRHEYDPITPKLNKLGFDTLAVDQRAGGKMFGFDNETATVKSGSFENALKDLEAALVWGTGKTPKVIVWGSSYSASLVFLLAAKHPDDVAAVLSFSPGEYLSGANAVRAAAAKVLVPVFITSASAEDEVAAANAILAAVPGGTKVQFVPKHGVHGSSTLRPDQNPKGIAENWAAVAAFLAGLK